ncbi:hypothetical protein NMY22_g12142 [Coprinellus aureogranulatus]|nr:hypothetical protein NMY22_g12142 [Coprinellus aureogranulatus]
MDLRRANGPSMQCPDIGVILAHFIRQIESRHIATIHQEPTPLHWNGDMQCLELFPWPLRPGTSERIPPSDWEPFRKTHIFRAPCCLCALLDNKPYTESRVAVVEIISGDPDGPKGEYIATCAKQRCGFIYYPLEPQELAYISDIDKSLTRSGGLYQALNKAVVRGRGRQLLAMSPFEAQKGREDLIHNLSEGITEARFWATFVQCLVCRKVLFRETFSVFHTGCIENRGDDGSIHNQRSRGPAMHWQTTIPFPALIASAGDVAEELPLRSLYSDSPTPTEIL